MNSPSLIPSFRERNHSMIWSLIWPARMWFTKFPIHRGKGLLFRNVILPVLPPKPASFAYRMPHGQQIDLRYREDLGTLVLFHGGYEDREIAELCKYIPLSGAVFDVGANIGLSSLEFSRSVARMAVCSLLNRTLTRLRGCSEIWRAMA